VQVHQVFQLQLQLIQAVVAVVLAVTVVHLTVVTEVQVLLFFATLVHKKAQVVQSLQRVDIHTIHLQAQAHIHHKDN
jgi:hypothetical protein